MFSDLAAKGILCIQRVEALSFIVQRAHSSHRDVFKKSTENSGLIRGSGHLQLHAGVGCGDSGVLTWIRFVHSMSSSGPWRQAQSSRTANLPDDHLVIVFDTVAAQCLWLHSVSAAHLQSCDVHASSDRAGCFRRPSHPCRAIIHDGLPNAFFQCRALPI